MFRTCLLLTAFACLLCCDPCPAAGPPAAPLPFQIAGWIDELGDDSFAVREAATKKLRAAGPAAEALLEKAMDSKDAEVVRRARSILVDFRWGIYPQTPAKIIELIRRYQTAARAEKRTIIQKLFDAGTPGLRALVKIARAEQDPLVRKDVFADLAASMIRGVPVLLEEGNLAALEGLLQLAVEGDVKTGATHQAAYLLATGQLAKHIALLEARKKANPPGKIEAEILAYLYRAKGDLVPASKAAADAEQNELLEGILYESANWQELARQPELTDTRMWTRYVGSRAAYSRLAGHRKAYEAAIKDILDRARPIADSKGNVMPYAKVLFLNACPGDALKLLKKAESQSRLRFEALVTQMNLNGAFAVVDAARKANTPDLGTLELLRARVLHNIGEKKQALAILDRYAEQIKPGTNAGWFKTLVEVEMQIGRVDEAFRHAAKVLAVMDDPSGTFEQLFPDQDDEAEILWEMFRRADPKQSTEKVLARMRLLLAGKATLKEVEALVTDAGKEPPRVLAAQRVEEWLAAGEAARLCKADKQAQECFRKAGGIRGGIRLGDLFADRKQWSEAAACYLAAYKSGIKAPDGDRLQREDASSLPALALYLHGDALVKAGRTQAGNKRIEQAHLLPLGSGGARYHFAKALRKRGHRQAASREWELLRRLGDPILADPAAFFTGEGMRAGAIEAADRKEYLKAADGYEQAFLRCLHTELNFARVAAYVTVPGHIYRTRAVGLALAGRLDEAKIEIARARASLPANVELVLRLVPILEKHKQKKEADELFKATFDVYEGVLRDYPGYAWAHNQAAWMSACCRRHLDKGLAHARKAIALAPKTAGYHDTLAEVLFQLGKKDEAIAAQKKAIELDPKRAYFRKQLKRIEAGDPKASQPDEEED